MELLLKYIELFPAKEQAGTLKGIEVEVDTQGADPVFQKPRPVPHALREEVNEIITDLGSG